MVYDQLGNKIDIDGSPKRIVSLVPSQTELLYHLGLEKEVVGITKFCIHPKEWFHNKKRVGGPKKVKIETVKNLAPDIIIANKEENTKEDVEKLRKIAPVWISDIFHLKDAMEMIEKVSTICGKKALGRHINKQIKINFEQLIPLKKQSTVLYMIWKKPFMAVGSDTFIHHILTEQLGFKNVLEEQDRYPEISLEQFSNVDYVFLSTEPYPFKEKHIPEFQEYFPHAQIEVVDGEYFTWYGSRLIDAPRYFQRLLKVIDEKKSNTQ